MNDTLKTISERFSCRDYSERMPENEYLDAIAQAAIQAPSGMNRQFWQVIVVKNKDILAEMDAEGMSVLSTMDKDLYMRVMARGGKLFYNAPCMMLIAIKVAPTQGAELIDCGIIAQNVALAATSLGIANLHCGCTGLAFAGHKAAEFKARLQFPEGYECGIGVLLGYARKTAPPHAPDQEKITVIE